MTRNAQGLAAACSSTSSTSWGDEFEKCEGRKTCFCVPPNFNVCFHGADCVVGEVCAEGAFKRFPICFSAKAEERLPSIQAVTVPEDTKGFEFDQCNTDDDCKPPRTCFEFFILDILHRNPCQGVETCACLTEQDNGQGCGPEDLYDAVEVCATTGFTVRGVPICVSKDMARAFSSFTEIQAADDSGGVFPSPSSDVTTRQHTVSGNRKLNGSTKPRR